MELNSKRRSVGQSVVAPSMCRAECHRFRLPPYLILFISTYHCMSLHLYSINSISSTHRWIAYGGHSCVQYTWTALSHFHYNTILPHSYKTLISTNKFKSSPVRLFLGKSTKYVTVQVNTVVEFFFLRSLIELRKLQKRIVRTIRNNIDNAYLFTFIAYFDNVTSSFSKAKC